MFLLKFNYVHFFKDRLRFNQGKHRYEGLYTNIESITENPIYDTSGYKYSGSLTEIDIRFKEDTFTTTIPLLDNMSQNSVIIKNPRHLIISGIPVDERPLEKINKIIAQYKSEKTH